MTLLHFRYMLSFRDILDAILFLGASSSSAMLLSRLSPLLRCSRSSPSTLVPVRSAWGPEHQPTPRGKHRPNKHKDPKFSKGRNYKVLRVQLPDHDFLRAMDRRETSPSEMRSYLRQVGMLAPGRQEWTERAPYISCTGAVLEEFVPPEGDGKASLMSKEVRRELQRERNQ